MFPAVRIGWRVGLEEEPVAERTPSTPWSLGVARIAYTHCTEGASVVLYTVQEGRPLMPGGKPLPGMVGWPTSNGIDATSQMWAFFRDHRLRTK